jgi:hypothetical protein
VSLLVAKMFKLKEKTIINQELTILDFIRLCFDDCALSDLSIDAPFGFFSSGKWRATPDEIEKKIHRFGIQPKFHKTESFLFYTLLSTEIRNGNSDFPKPKKTKFIPNKIFSGSRNQFEFFLVSEVVDWLEDNLDELGHSKLPDWAKNKVGITNKNVSDLVDINTLPLPLKLAVAAHLNINWDSTDLSTIVGKDDFNRETKKFLINKAREWEVYLDYKKGKHIIGVGNENIRIITRWIKPDIDHK